MGEGWTEAAGLLLPEGSAPTDRETDRQTDRQTEVDKRVSLPAANSHQSCSVANMKSK